MALWARIGAGFVCVCGALGLTGLAVMFLAGHGLPPWPWYAWWAFGAAALRILPLFAFVAWRGHTPRASAPGFDEADAT